MPERRPHVERGCVGADRCRERATCTSGATDVGAPSSFVTGSPVYNSTGSSSSWRRRRLSRSARRARTRAPRCGRPERALLLPAERRRVQVRRPNHRRSGSRRLTHYSMCTLANATSAWSRPAVAKSQRLWRNMPLPGLQSCRHRRQPGSSRRQAGRALARAVMVRAAKLSARRRSGLGHHGEGASAVVKSCTSTAWSRRRVRRRDDGHASVAW